MKPFTPESLVKNMKTVYSIKIPFPVPYNRAKDEWTTCYHQLLFARAPTKQELLQHLHDKGHEAYENSENENNLWWDLVEVVERMPEDFWVHQKEFNETHLLSSNRPLNHPIMGTVSILWEKFEVVSVHVTEEEAVA